MRMTDADDDEPPHKNVQNEENKRTTGVTWVRKCSKLFISHSETRGQTRGRTKRNLRVWE